MIISNSESEQYITKIANDNTFIFADATKEKGGNGEYFRPHDLLCAGLAACLNITARMVLEKEHVSFDKVIIKVDLDRSIDNETTFLYDIDIVGDISENKKKHLISLIEKCPVRKTLSKEIKFKPMYNN